MTSPSVRRRLRAHAYRFFYSLPSRWRVRVVRLFSQKFILGSVALVRDADAAAPGRIVLLRQPPGLGWSLPAGLMKRGERPIRAAIRELHEETGIAASPDQVQPANPNAIVHTKPGSWVDMVFDVTVPASEVTLTVDGGEVLEAQWHRIDNLPPLTTATARLLANYGIGPYAEFAEVKQDADLVDERAPRDSAGPGLPGDPTAGA
jgi:8-oxo-dGTP pyrophosphatase MutT (NUDIX family)